MAVSTPKSPRVAFLPDEKQRLEGLILALKKEKEVLRAAMAELEAALERKAEATTAAPEEGSETEDQRSVSCRRVQVVVAAAPDSRGRAALRRKQLASDRAKARQNCLAE
jgi:hypothetical protein